ncbi:M4 family metallopeptidase [Laceyella putida]|uniref:Neutral metalloproteinase n=1 Tax=Laceyella putida TaxID=110101 RepID=A0ABW2RIY7_9BACL
MKRNWLPAGVILSVALGTSGFLGGFPVEAKNVDIIKYNQSYHTPKVIVEKWAKPKTQAGEVVWAYLNAKRGVFQFEGNATSRFKITNKEKDSKTGTVHYRLQETVHGIPVYSADQSVHLDKQGNVTSFFGQVIPHLEQKTIPTKAKLSKRQAVQTVQADLGHKGFDGKPEATLYIYPHGGKFYLAYLVKASVLQPEPGYWHYFVDATTGRIINKFNAVEHITGNGTGSLGDKKEFEVTQSDKGYDLVDGTRGGGISTYDAQHTEDKLPGTLVSSDSTTFSNPAAVDAHANAEKVYDYYKSVHGRNSYNGNGAKIISSVHVGTGWDNAAWDGKQMVYGDGDGTEFKVPFSTALDVIGHELTHAVTESTANLQYQDESGALNESLSDIFGAMVDADDWDMGEDLGKTLRSMSDPKKYGQPDNYKDYVKTPDDNGGVHTNSGINNKAAYLLADGGSEDGVSVVGIGRDKTAKIYYQALTKYLTSTSDFAMMRQAAVQAATDLYGASSSEVQSVKDAYTTVGVNE